MNPVSAQGFSTVDVILTLFERSGAEVVNVVDTDDCYFGRSMLAVFSTPSSLIFAPFDTPLFPALIIYSAFIQISTLHFPIAYVEDGCNSFFMSLPLLTAC